MAGATPYEPDSPTSRPTVLIADDDPGIIIAGRFLLEDEGFNILEARSPSEALRIAGQEQVDLALVDMNYNRNTTSGQEGLDLVASLRELDPDLPVVVMTAWGTIDLAIKAIKGGATDFVQKPWDNVRVLQQIRSHSTAGRMLRRNRLLEQENELLRRQGAPEGFVCESAPMRRIMDIVEQVAPSRANILLLGENGTGKGVLARIIHDRSSVREGPYISVNMGGLPESLFESEMFGHVKGAFTDAKCDRAGRFELAKGGSIFLDEIGNMTLGQQSRLLRLLETGEYERVGSSRTLKADVRIIAATNADLHAAVQSGAFREDLFFRLNTVPIELPPLRERREDLIPLCRSFVDGFARKYGKKILGMAADAERAILDHPWPGNIRELSHAVERGVLMCRNQRLALDDLALRSQSELNARRLDEMSIEEVEKLLMRKALLRHEGNVTKAAEQLGMSRATFYRKLKQIEP